VVYKAYTAAQRALDTTVREASGRVELVFAGKREPWQLSLDLDGPLSREVMHGILRELKEDGLRDWLLLHRMAGQQGASGSFIWTRDEHLERTAYATRVKGKNTSLQEISDRVVSRLWRLKRAEIRAEVQRGDNLSWVRVGPFGLLDILAGTDELTKAGRKLTSARMALNPVIYEGAERGSAHPHFALLPEATLKLPAAPLRLAVELTYWWHDQRRLVMQDGIAEITAATLWDWVGLRAGKNTNRKRWPAVHRSLERSLAQLANAIGINWTTDGAVGPRQIYRITPPISWRDRAVLGVPPAYLATGSTPRTGAELKTWREQRGLSQRELGCLLGISQPTLGRREKAATLPAELIAQLATIDSER